MEIIESNRGENAEANRHAMGIFLNRMAAAESKGGENAAKNYFSHMLENMRRLMSEKHRRIVSNKNEAGDFVGLQLIGFADDARKYPIFAFPGQVFHILAGNENDEEEAGRLLIWIAPEKPIEPPLAAPSRPMNSGLGDLVLIATCLYSEVW